MPVPIGTRIERQESWHCALHAFRNAIQDFEAMTLQLLIQGAHTAAWHKCEPLEYHYDPARGDGFSIEAVADAAAAAGYSLHPSGLALDDGTVPADDLRSQLFQLATAESCSEVVLGLFVHMPGHYVAIRKCGEDIRNVMVQLGPCTRLSIL